MARSRLTRVSVAIDDCTTDWNGPDATLNGKGAGDAPFLLAGWSPSAAHPYDGVARSYAHAALTSAVNNAFPGLGWSGVKVIRLAYISLSTRQIDGPTGTPSYPYVASYFLTGSDAKVRIQRLTRDPVYHHNADGKIGDPGSSVSSSRWATADDSSITGDDADGPHYDEFVSPNDKGETRIVCTKMVGEWAPGTSGGHQLTYYDHTSGRYVQCGDPDDHTAVSNHGFSIRASGETRSGADSRCEFYSTRADVLARYKPHLVLIVEPYGAKPYAPRQIEPRDEVPPDQDYEGYIEEDPDNPVISIELMVNNAYDGGGQTIWNPTLPRSLAWPDGRFLIPTPRQPLLDFDSPLSWRARARTANSPTPSEWTGWLDHTIRRATPTVTPQPLGSQVRLLGTRLRASFTTP